MSLPIVLIPEAWESFNSISAIIYEQWGGRILAEFHTNVSRSLQLISEQPFMYQASLVDNRIRVGRIGPLISFLYEVREADILVYCFWDNRQEPLI